MKSRCFKRQTYNVFILPLHLRLRFGIQTPRSPDKNGEVLVWIPDHFVYSDTRTHQLHVQFIHLNIADVLSRGGIANDRVRRWADWENRRFCRRWARRRTSPDRRRSSFGTGLKTRRRRTASSRRETLPPNKPSPETTFVAIQWGGRKLIRWERCRQREPLTTVAMRKPMIISLNLIRIFVYFPNILLSPSRWKTVTKLIFWAINRRSSVEPPTTRLAATACNANNFAVRTTFWLRFKKISHEVTCDKSGITHWHDCKHVKLRGVVRRTLGCCSPASRFRWSITQLIGMSSL